MSETGMAGAPLLSLFEDEDPDEVVQGPLRLKPKTWEALTRIAEAEDAAWKAKGGAKLVSRNDVMRRVLEKFVAKWKPPKAEPEAKSKKQ